MYSVGDTVVYGGGVMTVVDIREEEVFGSPKKYYVLRAMGAGDSSLTFVPCDNEALVGSMHPLITEAGIDDLIFRLKEIPKSEWIEDSKTRSNLFKKSVESGDRLEMLKLIRDVKLNNARRAGEGKKGYLSDENLMKRAERRLYSEFSAVLGIDYKDVEEYINQKLK